MTTVTIYHNPKCSKSRQTLALLVNEGISPTIIEYLKETPDFDSLSKILDLLGMEPRQLMRQKEKEYSDNGLADQDLSRDQLIQAMIDHPKLMERPVVVANGRAAIGRPPEDVLKIL